MAEMAMMVKKEGERVSPAVQRQGICDLLTKGVTYVADQAVLLYKRAIYVLNYRSNMEGYQYPACQCSKCLSCI